MQEKTIDILIAIGIIIAVLLLWYMRENYVDKREKAEAIVNWMDKNKFPSFDNFKDDIKGGDIVEYSEAKKLQASGSLTPDSLESRI